MPEETAFQQMVEAYRKREKSSLVDAIAVGFSYADELSVDLGLLEDTGLLPELLNAVSVALPFAVAAVTEGTRVLLRRKTPTAGAQDAVYRMLKSGAAMGAGAVTAAAGGAAAALPVAVSVRVLLDRYRSRALVGKRVKQRLDRVRAIRLEKQKSPVRAVDTPRITEGDTD